MYKIVRNQGPYPYLMAEGDFYPTNSIRIYKWIKRDSPEDISKVFMRKVDPHDPKSPYIVPLYAFETKSGKIIECHEIAVDAQTKNWAAGLKVGDRLYANQTLNSMRSNRAFKPRSTIKDSLDLVLNSAYDVQTAFPQKGDFCVQPESLEQSKWKRMGNNSKPVLIARTLEKSPQVRRGGVPERLNPNSVKLNFTTHHAFRSYNGYHRKDNGTFYDY